jgi:hypothetical protein
MRNRGVAVALEVQDDVDDVLEHARAGDRAVLGDVADDDRGDVAGLGHADQARGDLLDLGDATGNAVEVGGPMVWIESTTSTSGAPARRG